MRQPIYLVVGAPGSGKTWLCRQLKDKFTYIPHDENIIPKQHLDKTIAAASWSDKPILIDTPFSVTQIVEPLKRLGLKITPVFVIETPRLTRERYENREGKPIPKGHLTRIETYKKRALELGAFKGTSTQVLQHLKDIKP
jgi:hypothetical protein